jgi:hypothetical protein
MRHLREIPIIILYISFKLLAQLAHPPLNGREGRVDGFVKFYRISEFITNFKSYFKYGSDNFMNSFLNKTF